MMAQSWTAVVIDIASSMVEPVANFLIEIGAPGLELQESQGNTRLIAHYPAPAPTARIRNYLREIGAGAAQLDAYAVGDQNWAENWKGHFQPLSVGERLWIHPPWESKVPPDRVGVVINPGMAFGTGQHASTSGCLELLEAVVAGGPIKRALDLGTGSGILAIALAKLGVPRITAIDSDREACAVARENIAQNAVACAIEVAQEWRPQDACFDLIVANLYADLLCELAARLGAALAPSGTMVCSGFVSHDADKVHQALRAHGFTLLRTWSRDDWFAFSLSGPAQ